MGAKLVSVAVRMWVKKIESAQFWIHKSKIGCGFVGDDLKDLNKNLASWRRSEKIRRRTKD